MNFQKNSGEGLTEPPPQTPPSLYFGFRHRYLGTLRPILEPHHRVLGTPGKHYFRRHRMFDCFDMHTFAKKHVIYYRQAITPNVAHGIKIIVIFIAPNCTISSLNFQIFSRGLTEPPPQTPSQLYLGLRPRCSVALFALHSSDTIGFLTSCHSYSKHYFRRHRTMFDGIVIHTFA